MMNTTTIRKAKEIWSYMSAVESIGESDAIVICCSYDLRVCDHACRLMAAGNADRLVISGRSGNWTRHLWNEPEARIFCERAIRNGIGKDRILLEPNARNLGENMVFSRALIPRAKTVTLVSKPNSLLRIKLTADAQWPGVKAFLSCPKINFPEDISNLIGIWGVINEMVGDIERIQKYPALGFQSPHALPEYIIEHWNYLVEQGFTAHLMPGQALPPGSRETAPLSAARRRPE